MHVSPSCYIVLTVFQIFCNWRWCSVHRNMSWKLKKCRNFLKDNSYNNLIILMDSEDYRCLYKGYKGNFLKQTNGDKISWGSCRHVQSTLATIQSYIFCKDNLSKKYFSGIPLTLPPNQCCTAVDKARRKQKRTQHCPGGAGEGPIFAPSLK